MEKLLWKIWKKEVALFDAETIKPIANLSNKDKMTLNPGNIIFDMLILLSKFLNNIVIVIMQKILLSKIFQQHDYVIIYHNKHVFFVYCVSK